METPSAASATKRCPECNTHIPIEATRCTACDRRVGKVDKHGVSRKAFNYRAYVELVLALAALGGFVWWFFLN